MEKKSNKGFIVTIVILVLICLGLSGYIAYDKLLKELLNTEKESQEVTNKEDEKNNDKEEYSNFYDIDELVKNNYIEKITETSAEQIKIKAGKVYIAISYDYEGEFKEVKGIEGTPKYVYESLISMHENEYVVITTEGDVYYTKEEDGAMSEFKKVNQTKAINVYKIVAIEKHIPLDAPYYETEEHELISVIDGKTKIEARERYVYPDESYKLSTGYEVNFYIKYDKTMVIYDYDKKEFIELKYKENPITAKDIFSKIKVNDNDEEIQQDYVIGQDNKIYIIEQIHHSSKITKIDLYNNKEVKDYKVTKITSESSDYRYKVEITYTDGTTETLNDVATSTLYYRNK